MAFDYDYLRKDLKEAFGQHWGLNDAAHQQSHFEEVYRTGYHINKKLGWHYDPKDIFFAAYFHDLFAWSRINHHELSAHWFETTDHLLILLHYGNNLSGRRLVTAGCREHRASFKGEFSNTFAELINSADRGMPGDASAMLFRAVQYREHHFPEQSEDQRMAESIKHIKDKFGHNGYARYPNMYKRVFGEELELQRQAIDKL